MSPRTQTSCHLFLKYMISLKFYFLVTGTSFAFSLLWVQLFSWHDQPDDTESVTQEARESDGGKFVNEDKSKKVNTLPKDFKCILLWTRHDYSPFFYFGKGQAAFKENKCSTFKCYVTPNRKFFGGDLTRFDAIAFNGRNMKPSDLPHYRSRHQKYIFINIESADNVPVCEERFDSFFNWTSTYRLDSDIPYPYILIRDKKGEIVGPKLKMQWKEDSGKEPVDDEFAIKIRNKTKAAAWFVSNCHSRSDRQDFVKSLNKALKPYGLAVDVYGSCSSMNCPKSEPSLCNDLLKYNYFFYMSMENSFNADYVTEKLLRALQNDVVPIVYGGADYTRFLPPGSYIDGRAQPVAELAALMNKTIYSPKEYRQYFKWKRYYTYYNALQIDVCDICKALHNEKMFENTSIYHNFRKWWNPNYKKRCYDLQVPHGRPTAKRG